MGKHTDIKAVEALDAVRNPIERARGLGNEHYVDPETFERERQAVLFGTWAGIGFGKDVPEAGDAKPVDFLGQPLLIVRDKDGTLRVFHNVCRHRGMILVEEPRKITGAIRCPYHSWCYALNGQLRSTPHVGGPGQNTHQAMDRDDLGMLEVRSRVWRDVIFVNMDGEAEDFETATAALQERWKEFDQPMVPGGESSSFKLDVNCNWKLAVENYCESYHLPWVHPGLNSYSRLEDHYHIEEPDKFSGQGTLVYRQLKDDAGTHFPDFNDLGEFWDTGAEYISFFPNVLFGVHRDHAYAILLEPVGLDRTREHVEIYYPASMENTPEREALKEHNAKLWKGVFEEDIFVVEGMQKGRHSSQFDGGRFSPVMDNPTHLFHAWVAQRLGDKMAEADG
ncbi:MAG: SRPBCC family protein [Pseudomonadota bacterium]